MSIPEEVVRIKAALYVLDIDVIIDFQHGGQNEW